MKFLILLLLAISFSAAVQAQEQQPADTAGSKKVLEAACGQCRFGLPGKGCDLAVRMEGKAYFVDGTGIDEHGDAHAKEGFCNAVRRAEVVGALNGERFKVTFFRLLPPEHRKN